jgi:hypothetical protein
MKILYIIALLLLFGVGVYTWKIRNTGQGIADLPVQPKIESSSSLNKVLVSIGDDVVTAADVEFEYQLHTADINDREELTPIPDLGSHYNAELQSLRKRIASNIIERKMLYRFVQKDKTFNYQDPSRYMECLEEFNEAIENPERQFSKENQKRLKNRLCEQSVVQQYMDERLFENVDITENQIVEFYKNNLRKFKRNERVQIRQVVTASESKAKQVRARARKNNFDQIARELSIAPEAEQGGLLKPFSKGEMPAVFDPAFTMRKGQISGILKSEYGYHVIMVVEKFPKKDLSLKDAEPHIRTILIRRWQDEVYQKWVESALAATDIKTPSPIW